ncbi:MAG: hypothetical protein ACRDP5_22115 [Streptosporangiaceae bacterium]
MADVDPVPAGNGSPSPAGSGPDAVAGALRAADALARMGVRRHPVVPAAILSGLAVQAVEIAAAVNRGRCGDLDRPLIRALAGGLGRDLDRARRYAVARNLQLGTAVSRGRVPARVLRPARYTPAMSLAFNFHAALDLARELGEAIDAILGPYLDLRLTFSRDDDLEQARELADAVGGCLGRASALAAALGERPAREQVLGTGRVISRVLGQALEYARALDRVCAQGLAGRLGITTAQGLAQAVADGGLDDFTSADLTCASLAGADLTGVRWSLTGTAWPAGTDIGALLARSQAQPGGVLVLRHRGMMWQPAW